MSGKQWAPPPPDVLPCPMCGHPEVALSSGRFNVHRRADRPGTKCPASGLQPADVS